LESIATRGFLTFVEILTRNPHGRSEGIDITEEMLAHARRKAAEVGVSAYRPQTSPKAAFSSLLRTIEIRAAPLRRIQL